MFCYCPTSLSICPPFGIFGAFPYFIKVTHAVFSDRDKRKKVGKKDFPCRSENATSSPGRFSLALGAGRPQSQGKAPWGRGCGKCNEIDSVKEENVVMTKPITLSWL